MDNDEGRGLMEVEGLSENEGVKILSIYNLT
jgi:hypothetical protein